MADIVKDATLYRIKQIELAEAEYYKTLIKTLDRIEREVVSLASRLPNRWKTNRTTISYSNKATNKSYLGKRIS